jgi:hypothetical protein
MASEDREVRVGVGDDTVIEGTLVAPEGAPGVLLFAHGSGSSRHSRCNRYIASFLQGHSLATLLTDLTLQSGTAKGRHSGVGLLDRRGRRRKPPGPAWR